MCRWLVKEIASKVHKKLIVWTKLPLQIITEGSSEFNAGLNTICTTSREHLIPWAGYKCGNSEAFILKSKLYRDYHCGIIQNGKKSEVLGVVIFTNSLVLLVQVTEVKARDVSWMFKQTIYRWHIYYVGADEIETPGVGKLRKHNQVNVKKTKSTSMNSKFNRNFKANNEKIWDGCIYVLWN